MAAKFCLTVDAHTENESRNTEATFHRYVEISSGSVGPEVNEAAIHKAIASIYQELMATFAGKVKNG